jgi:predicted membrane protein
LGTIFFGIILMVLGALWLLDLSGVLNVTWTIVGAVLLVVIGLALIVGAREGAHGGLIALGIFLAVILGIASVASVPQFGEGVGDRTHRPETVAELADGFEWGVGSHILDLRGIDFPQGEYETKASTGIGELIIIVPQNAEVRVTWSVGIGEARLLDREHGGLGISGDWATPNYGNADVSILIDASVGIGSMQVRR